MRKHHRSLKNQFYNSNMDIKRLLILTLSIVVSCAIGRAEEPLRAELTLEQAIEIALSDNPTIKIANLEVDRQEYVRKETRGHLLPSVSAQEHTPVPLLRVRWARVCLLTPTI